MCLILTVLSQKAHFFKPEVRVTHEITQLCLSSIQMHIASAATTISLL